MTRPSDREFALKRKIKDLEEQLRQRDEEIKQLKKKIDKLQVTDENPKKKPTHEIKDNSCPQCGASVTESILPFGKLILCSKGCGHREIKR